MANYEYIFKNDSSDTYRVRINDNTVLEDVYTTVFPASNGFNLTWQGAEIETTYASIINSNFDCALLIDANTRTLIQDIAASEMGRFTVNVWKLIGVNTYDLYWYGYVFQDSMQIPDAANLVTHLNVSAIDGFGELQGVEWDEWAENDLDNSRSVVEFLTLIITKLPSLHRLDSLPILRTASVWYEDSMESSVIPTPENADPLYTTYIKDVAFVLQDEYGVIKGLTYYDILKTILEIFNLQISLWNGVYLVIQQNTYDQTTTRAWNYTKTGVFLDTELIDLQSDFDLEHRLTGGIFTYLTPVRKVSTKYNYRPGIYGNNLLPPIVLRDTSYSLGDSIQDGIINFGGVIQTDFEGDGDLYRIRVFYKLLIRNGTHYLNGTPSDCEWTTDSNSYVAVYSTGFKSNSTVTLFTNFNITTTMPEDLAALTFEWQFSDLVTESGYVGWVPDVGTTQTMTHSSVEGTFSATISDGGIPMEGTKLFAASVSEDIKFTYELPETIIGDGPFPLSAGAMRVRNSSGVIVMSDKWSLYSDIGVANKQYDINDLRCVEMLALRRDSTMFLEGATYAVPDIHKGFVFKNGYYIFLNITWNADANLFNFIAIKIA